MAKHANLVVKDGLVLVLVLAPCLWLDSDVSCAQETHLAHVCAHHLVADDLYHDLRLALYPCFASAHDRQLVISTCDGHATEDALVCHRACRETDRGLDGSSICRHRDVDLGHRSDCLWSDVSPCPGEPSHSLA